MTDWLLLPLKDYIADLWPAGLPDPPSPDILEGSFIEPLNITTGKGVTARAGFVIAKYLPFSIPGIDGFSIVIRPPPAGEAVQVVVETDPKPELSIQNVPLSLRLASKILQPAHKVTGGDGSVRIKADANPAPLEIDCGRLGLVFDFEGNFDLSGGGPMKLPLCVVGNTGVGLEAGGVQLFGSIETPPPGKPAGWRGLHIQSGTLYFPGDIGALLGQLTITDAYIGNGGFSGTVSQTRTPPVAGHLAGLQFEVRQVSLTFVQNTISASSILGRLNIPFFDAWVEVDVGIGLDGSFSIRLIDGLPTLSKPGLLELHLDSLKFARAHSGVLSIALSGRLKPLVAGLDWPTFDLRELSIDSEGNVSLEGGWLELGNHYSLDFHGFGIEITKLGFGKNTDGSRWLGLSGGIQLVEGLPAGASVDGLRISWSAGGGIRVSLEGVAVSFEAPGAFSFSGEVSYKESAPGEFRFDGDIRLKLIALQIEIDGQLVIGQQNGTNYFAIYLGVELPAGIPLGPTGLGLYGLAGLFAHQMSPNKQPAEGWYENLDGSDGWYKRPPMGISDLKSKWGPEAGALGFGAGLTIGTLPDNGFDFSGRVLLAIILPGPIIMIEGRANILKERASLSDDPLFRALAVLDGRAGTTTIGLFAHFGYLVDGELIDLQGSAEAFFNFNDPGAWHIYIGRDEPRDRRISADIFFHMFGAQAYFMLDGNSLKLGAWVGYDRHWKFGPLAIDLESWLEGGAAITLKPVHFHGDIWLHGRWAASAFGFGMGMSVDASLAVDVFTPFHIKGDFRAGIELPWPLPDLFVTISLEWGDETQPQPPIPLPLKDVTVEHLKTTTTWPLPRNSYPPLLLPNYDDGSGYIGAPAAIVPTAPPPVAAMLPVVPLDSRLGMTFGRHVNDDAGIAIPKAPDVIEQIGDPATGKGPLRVRYGLQSVQLDRWDGAAWKAVAGRPAAGVPELYATWAAMPNGAHSKLLVWSKSVYDYTRNASQAWNAKVIGSLSPEYPCEPAPAPAWFCWDWRGLPPGSAPSLPSLLPQAPEFKFAWTAGGLPASFCPVPLGSTKPGQALACGPAPARLGELTVALPWPASAVSIRVLADLPGSEWGQLLATDEAGLSHTAVPNGVSAPSGTFHETLLEIDQAFGAPDLVSLRLRWIRSIYLVEICLREGGLKQAQSDVDSRNKGLAGELARWSQEGQVLEPNSIYRLKIETTAARVAPAGAMSTQDEYAFFRTEGPPGLAALSVPANQPKDVPFASGLDDLMRYVRQTLPETVPAPNARPRVPRPVYRAYDIGVSFNEDYVEMLYRKAERDLGLYLFDANGRPARDNEGRLLAMGNAWGKAETLLLTEGDVTWLALVNQSTCARVDLAAVPRDSVIRANEGHLLASDTLYEARLTRLLLHETFTSGLDGWTAANLGSAGNWVASFHEAIAGTAAQIASSGPGSALVHLDGAADLSVLRTNQDVVRLWDDQARASKRYRITAVNNGAHQIVVEGNPSLRAGTSRWEIPALGGAVVSSVGGTGLVAGDPAWSDYRLSTLVRLAGSGEAGLVFRYADPSSYLRVTLSSGAIRLTRLSGVATVLATTLQQLFAVEGDQQLAVEVLGDKIQVYVDGANVISQVVPGFGSGCVGLYSALQAGGTARFSDVRLDDLRASAGTVYRFTFTTSRFTNFLHQIHSANDETTVRPADIAAFRAKAVAPAAAQSEDESRAYGALAEAVLGPDASQNPSRTRISRIGLDGRAGFLIEHPEPIDCPRLGLVLQRADLPDYTPSPPTDLKLTRVTFGGAPNQESVELLARDGADLGGRRLEYRFLPGATAIPADPVLLHDDFAVDAAPVAKQELLWEAAFNDLSEMQVPPFGPVRGGPTTWTAAGGTLSETSGAFFPRVIFLPNQPDLLRPATAVVHGDADWEDVRLSTRITAPVGGAAGLLLRVTGSSFYYFVVWNRPTSPVPRGAALVRSVAGTRTTLWTAAMPALDLTVVHDLVVESCGPSIVGSIDGAQMFATSDTQLLAGKAGMACAAAKGVKFTDVKAEAVGVSIAGWQIQDEGSVSAPSAWAIADGALKQTSAIAGAAPPTLGTNLLAGSTDWTDYRASVLMRSMSGAVGLVFRHRDTANFYRFSIDGPSGARRLDRRLGGVWSTLWQAAGGYPQGNTFLLEVEVIGRHLRGFIDGDALFSVPDTAHPNGAIGISCAANPTLLVYAADVVFVQPDWRPYFTFASGRLAEGDRLQLFAGNAASAPAPEAGVVQRFNATGASSGTTTFTTDGIDLRLVDADGVPRHTCRFRPDSAYQDIAVNMLRKADGTAVCIFPAAPATLLDPGAYRLVLAYRRNNQALDPASSLLSQADNRSDEHAWLQISWEPSVPTT
jgi:hypothetical protein